jgi:hypothetical protein
LAESERDEALGDLAAAKAETAKLRELATALIDALPKCDECSKPATRAFRRGEGRWCDACGFVAPEYPRAAPLRALMAEIR